MKTFKEFLLNIISGEKCPECGTRNHTFINDPIWDYGKYIYRCHNCNYKNKV